MHRCSPVDKHLGSVRELFSLADKGVERSNGCRLDKFGFHVAKAMNCSRNQQGERGGRHTYWGVYNETKKRQTLIQFWQK